MDKLTAFKQWQTVTLNPEITNCPGHTVSARIISLNHEKEEAYIQILGRCQGCDCGPESRMIKLKWLEVSNG